MVVKKKIYFNSIDLEEGSFINFQDTSYLATKCVFFQPSRHLIDGERFDFEMNIYHGKFDETTGYSTHLHYHSDKDENNNKKYHEHIHYHQGENADKHDNFSDKADKNVVLCILFNREYNNLQRNTFKYIF